VGTQVEWELIFQGGPTIQTMVLPGGYVSVSEELRDERWVTPNCGSMSPQFERR
jgi:hypothetical protein